jgi:hypothetical protein
MREIDSAAELTRRVTALAFGNFRCPRQHHPLGFELGEALRNGVSGWSGWRNRRRGRNAGASVRDGGARGALGSSEAA